MNTRKVTWIIAGILFAAASIWIHYEVKVNMLHRGGRSIRELGTIKVAEMAPDFSARDLKGREVVLSAFRDKKMCCWIFERPGVNRVGWQCLHSKRFTMDSKTVG